MKEYKKLKMLLQHLETGEMLHKNFDFSAYNKNVKGEVNGIANCGTSGCALGEMPILDSDFTFNRGRALYFKNNYVYFITDNNLKEHAELLKYFNLNKDEFNHLFYPIKQNVELYGGQLLKSSATKSEVINNIKEFLKIKQNENA